MTEISQPDGARLRLAPGLEEEDEADDPGDDPDDRARLGDERGQAPGPALRLRAHFRFTTTVRVTTLEAPSTPIVSR